MVQRYYPNQVKMMEKEDFELTAKLWERTLWNIDFQNLAQALVIYTRLNKFAPHPSDLIEIVAKKHNPEAFKTSESAWEDVSRAVKKYGFHNQKLAFESFDTKTLRVVKNISWWTMCYSERPDMVKRDFCQIWDNLGAVEQEQILVDHTKWIVEQTKNRLKKRGSLNDPSS
jgi:hypothetical protein